MFKINEYFDGNVKSIAFETPACPATIGIIAPGQYEFGTSTIEIMTVITGKLSALLPDSDKWTECTPGRFSAAEGSMEMMRPCATELRRITA